MCANLLTDNYGLYPTVKYLKPAIIPFIHSLTLHDRATISIRKSKYFPFLPFRPLLKSYPLQQIIDSNMGEPSETAHSTPGKPGMQYA